MKKHLKLIFSISLLFLFINYYGQTDTLHQRNKYSILPSLSIGLPIYNEFLYLNDNSDSYYKVANSKKKIMFNANINFNLKHLTLGILINYSQNEFDGNSYKINGLELYTPSHGSTVYKNFEIYQHVKYNQFQFGTGVGYNKWIKKGNLSITFNVIKTIFLASSVKISSHYNSQSTYNDNDTIKFSLAKEHKAKDLCNEIEVHASLKIAYTYPIYKRLYASASFNFSYGFLDVYSTKQDNSGTSDYYFGYYVYNQKTITPIIGIGYRLK